MGFSGEANPWLHLPATSPFVLPIDAPFINALNGVIPKDSPQQIVTDLLPNPFSGLHEAPVVILLANPGLDSGDKRAFARADRREAIMKGLQSAGGAEFWPLLPMFESTPAGRWWRTRTADLAAEVGGAEVLAGKILAIDFHGYHSKQWLAPLVTFPSQHFGFALVRQAMGRGALIVMGRASRHWLAGIPGLNGYRPKVENRRSPRSAYLSRGNLSDSDFKRIVSALR